jgi:methionyl-tRNA formyltransferase
MRLVFAGTPEAALPALEAVLESHHEVAAVVTRPDAPAGRGRRLEPSPVARRAREAGLEVLTPLKARDPAFLDRLREIGPDCCPVTAYGALLPQAALDIPPRGWVNLHFSVLPAWRGASPVQHAILHGDDVTGATTFRIVKELDAGPVYGVVTEPVRSRDTAGELMARLARSGARLLADTLDGIESGQIRAMPQPDEGVSYAPKITPGDARVDWGHPAAQIDRLIRACTPEPGAWTGFGGTRLKLGPVEPVTGAAAGAAVPGGEQFAAGDRASKLAPGELLITRGAVFAGTGTEPVRLGNVQPPGKRPMPAAAWARGLHMASSSGQPPKLG